LFLSSSERRALDLISAVNPMLMIRPPQYPWQPRRRPAVDRHIFDPDISSRGDSIVVFDDDAFACQPHDHPRCCSLEIAKMTVAPTLPLSGSSRSTGYPGLKLVHSRPVRHGFVCGVVAILRIHDMSPGDGGTSSPVTAMIAQVSASWSQMWSRRVAPTSPWFTRAGM
jgi:hypothetical protein